MRLALALAAALGLAGGPALAQFDPSNPASRDHCRKAWDFALKQKLAQPRPAEGFGPDLLVMDEELWRRMTFENKAMLPGLYECAVFGTIRERRIEIRSNMTNKPLGEWDHRGLVVR